MSLRIMEKRFSLHARSVFSFSPYRECRRHIKLRVVLSGDQARKDDSEAALMWQDAGVGEAMRKGRRHTPHEILEPTRATVTGNIAPGTLTEVSKVRKQVPQ